MTVDHVASADGRSREQPGGAGAPPGVEFAGVTAWMQSLLPELQPPLAFHRIGDGRSNLTYRVVDAAGAEWILRRPPLGTLLRGAHDMAREHRLIAALHPAGVRVPEPYGFCDDPAVTGAPFYVMELVDGLVVTDTAALAPLPEPARATAAQSLIDALAQLHAVNVDTVGLGDLSRKDGYAERQLKAWSRQWEASKGRPIPGVERVRDLLAAAIPPQRRVAVVHGDFKLENVVLGPAGDVRAILDWELCTLGDPVADLGTLLTYWTRPGDPEHWSLAGLGTPSRADGFPSRDDLRHAYALATGDDLTSIDFFEALAAWKLAIIIQGVVKRFRETPANANMDVEALEPVLDGLVERAEGIAAGLR